MPEVPPSVGTPRGYSMDSEGKKQAEPEPPKEGNVLQRISAAVHDGLETWFYKQTHYVVEYPKATIAIVLFVCAVLAQGIWFYEEELAADKSFTPRDSRAVEEEEWVDAVYGAGERRVQVFFVAKPGNMLNRRQLRYIFDYQEYLETDLTAVSAGEIVHYDTVCGRYLQPTGRCKAPKSPLTLWQNNVALFDADPDIMSTINNETAWRAVEPTGPGLDLYLGKQTTTTVTDPVTGETREIIEGAEAVQVVYLLRNKLERVDGSEEDLESYEFENALAKWTREVASPEANRLYDIAVYTVTQGEADKAASEATSGDVSSLIIGYMLMLFYASFILFRGRFRASHAFLGLFSVVCVGLATFSAYGLMWFCGVKFNNVVQVLVLLLLGIGVDDTFVIMDSWWDSAHVPGLKERMKVALMHAGPAVTVTSLTDFVAFLAGSSTSIPALKDFCYYAAAGITFDFIYQTTLFVAVAFLDSLREASSRMDVLCCVVVKEDTGCWIEGPPCLSPSVGHRGLMHHLIGVVLPRATVRSLVGRAVVLVVTAVLLGVGIWGCTELKMNFDQEWFVPADADIRDAFDVRDEYFAGRSLPVNMYLTDMEFPTEEAQWALKQAVLVTLTDPFVRNNSVSSFFDPFIFFLQTEYPTFVDPNTGVAVASTYTTGRGVFVTSSIFLPALKVFASEVTGPLYARDFIKQLAWQEVNGEDTLKAVRMQFLLTDGPLGDGETAVDAMDSLRDTADKIPVPKGGRTFPWVEAFVFWESYKLFVPEITQNVAIAGCCVLFIVTIILANLYVGCIVAVIVGLIDVCLLGFMPVIGVDLNGVSVVCVVIAIGLSVDYSVHIAHAFLLVSAHDEEWASAKAQRAGYALWKMGPAVFNGGFSTFLAIAPLALASSYIFTVFFRMFFIIVVTGQFFGVIFLPVFLALVGPPPNAGAVNLAEKPWENPFSPDFDKGAPEHVDPHMRSSAEAHVRDVQVAPSDEEMTENTKEEPLPSKKLPDV